jgi:NADH-quinone oxidoreductase subunit L
MMQYAALIPFFPLAGFIIIGLLNKRLPKNMAATFACAMLLISFGLSLAIFMNISGQAVEVQLAPWINVGSFSASFNFLLDPLSSIFLMIITGVGFLIHVYSIGYMHDDEKHNIFFAYLNLFIFFMLILVLASSYLLMFVGWEGVGLCSYLLIGFWFKNKAYNDAAKKAFIMNRIGDLGFLLGIILLFITFGSSDYHTVFTKAQGFMSGDGMITAITLLLFVGAMGKSAQIPLYTWLPDAMAGPTPVSALIHAATMVTAGIYMVARSGILYALSPISMYVVALIGVVTAVFAASIALTQNDIKKVLAYSTVSQLGYMFLGLGVGAFSASVFHVMTHAFFKALLFLGAGSIIHGLAGEQDIRNMGGLRKKLPITFITFLLATLAISGIPPFSGFFSKDEILAHAFASNKLFWVLGVIGSMMTAFYMFRLLFLTFFGTYRGDEHKVHAHESPKVMTIPLIILAILSTIGGLVGVPESLGGSSQISKFLDPVFQPAQAKMMMVENSSSISEIALMGITVAVVLASIFLAWYFYISRKQVPSPEGTKLPLFTNLSYHKYYVDEIYNTLITKPLDKISELLKNIVDNKLIDGLVNASGKLTEWVSGLMKFVQTGNVDFYLLAMVISIAFIIFFKLM